MPGRREQGQPRRGEPLTRDGNHRPGGKILSCLANMGPGARRAVTRQRGDSIGAGNVLLHHDRVGTGGQRGAGEDARRVARSHIAGIAMAGGAFARHAPRPGPIGPADGVTVHGGGIERRLGEPCRHIAGQDAAMRGGDRDDFGRQRHNTGQQPVKRHGNRQQRHQGASHSPERPPDFLSRRTPEIVMPRSIALAMS